MIPTSAILKAKLLIVDDQVANVLLLERLLRSAGYSDITCTQNPTEVMDLHRQNKYDLILLDLNMPAMDGFQVMESLKSIDREGVLPVLVITAQPNEKLRALNAGALDFLSKPFDIAEVLARVQNLLLVRLLNLETQKLYQQVLVEQDLSEMLLHNMLPQAIAERLKGRSKLTANLLNQAIVDSYANVTVLFADIVGFTAFSQLVSPEVMVDVLNDLFTRFDHIAEHRGLEKIKTIGDCYMAVAGLPLARPDHAQALVTVAFEMIAALSLVNKTFETDLRMRIGLNTGNVVAGVIGLRKFT